MRLSYSIFLAATATMQSAVAFTSPGAIQVLPVKTKPKQLCFSKTAFLLTTSTCKALLMSDGISGDEAGGDDWYSDFDPSAFTDAAQSHSVDSSSYSSSSGYGGSSRNGSRDGGESRFDGRGRRGGNRGGHDYTRDTSRDSSNVDEAAVDALLSKRIDAKRSGDFDTADAIRDHLMSDFSVGVFDREKTWKSGCSASGSGMRGGRGRDRGGRGRDSGGPRRKKDFGPNGHDYYQCEDTGPITSSLSEPEINNLLAKRLEAKMSRNFDVADGIQWELNGLGVYVHDGMKEWRADGVPFGHLKGGDGGRGPGKTVGSRSQRNLDYTKSIHSTDVEGAEDKLINRLVMERNKHKLMRDFEKADAIREGLRSKFNVLLDDRIREWSVGGDFGEEHNAERELSDAFAKRGVVKSVSSLPLQAEDEEFIQMRVDQRSEAKKLRDFDTADEIREELLKNFDVMIQDKLRQWSAGGDFGDKGGSRRLRGVYTRRGGGDLVEEDVQAITDMLKERTEAKKQRDFDTADEIRDELRETWNVFVDDKTREWRVETDVYVQALNTGYTEVSSETIAIISAKLVERLAYRRDHNYEVADSIRDELADEFGVEIDDKNKEWKCENFGEDASDADTKFVEGGKEIEDKASGEELTSFVDNKETEEETAGEIANGGTAVTEEETESVFDESPSALSKEELSSLTVPALKEKLRESGLRVSGRKAELIERLLTSV